MKPVALTGSGSNTAVMVWPKMLCLEALHFLVLAMALKTLGSAHVNHPALHFGGHHSPSVSMACYQSMSTENPDLFWRYPNLVEVVM